MSTRSSKLESSTVTSLEIKNEAHSQQVSYQLDIPIVITTRDSNVNSGGTIVSNNGGTSTTTDALEQEVYEATAEQTEEISQHEHRMEQQEESSHQKIDSVEDNTQGMDDESAYATQSEHENTVYEGQSYAVSPGPVQPSNVKIVKVVPLPHARSEVWSYFGFIADDDGEIHDKKRTICKICATTLCYSGNTTNLFTHLKAMHPEVSPQKLTPTNKTPKQKKNGHKRKYYTTEDGQTVESITILPVEGKQFTPRSSQMQISWEQAPDATANSSGSTGTATVTNGTTHMIQVIEKPSPMLRQKHEQNGENHTSARDDEITAAIVNFIAKDCRPIGLISGKGFEELLRTVAPNYKLPEVDKLEPLVKRKYHDIRYNMFMRTIEQDADFQI